MPDDPDLGISGVIFMHKKRVGSDDPTLGRMIRTWGAAARAACDGAPVRELQKKGGEEPGCNILYFYGMLYIAKM